MLLSPLLGGRHAAFCLPFSRKENPTPSHNTQDYPKKLAFAFLEEIYRLFLEELKREFGTGAVDYRSRIECIDKPYYFIKFERVIQRKQREFRDPKSNSSLQKLSESLVEVRIYF